MSNFRQPRIEVPKLRKSAKGGPCHLQTPVCNGQWETVVLCHPSNGAMSMKADDLVGVFGCSSCHDLVDSRTKLNGEYLTEDQLNHYWLTGLHRQLRWWYEQGLLKV